MMPCCSDGRIEIVRDLAIAPTFHPQKTRLRRCPLVCHVLRPWGRPVAPSMARRDSLAKQCFASPLRDDRESPCRFVEPGLAVLIPSSLSATPQMQKVPEGTFVGWRRGSLPTRLLVASREFHSKQNPSL